MKILVIRNDKLGDFMLIWPALALLRAALPQAHIVALLPKYTSELGKLCPYIDEVIIDDEQLCAATIAKWQFDVQLTFFSSKKNAKLGRAAHIPIRIAPATKYWQFYYNHRVVQRRSRSLKPEFQYNIDLVNYLLNLTTKTQNQINISPPYWQPLSTTELANTRQQFLKAHNLPAALNIVVHPGCGGSANNLSIKQYAQLVDAIANKIKVEKVNFIFSAGPNELAQAQQLKSLYKSQATIWNSQQGLAEFAYNLAAAADVFIAGSTGTLHLAGVLDKATVGFYPATQACSALRWQTCASNYLAISAASNTPDDMQSIDMEAASTAVANFINQLFL